MKMKIKQLFYSFFVIIAASFASCENEPLEGEFVTEVPTNPSGNFQVEIDTELFVADHVQSSSTNMGLQIVASSATGENLISMTIANPTVGEHDLSSGTGNMITYTPGVASQTMYTNISGTITITEIDSENDLISGTFNAVLEEFDGEEANVEFTNGVFEDLDYTSEENNDPAIFEAELDGELFTASIVEAEVSQNGLEMAAQNENEAIGIQIFNLEEGTFDLSNENVGILLYSPDINSEEIAYNLTEGTVTITEIDYDNSTISGEFVGTLSEWAGEAEDIQVTNGIFTNIPFSQEGPVGGDYATALIDGEEFVANIFGTVEGGNTLALNFVRNNLESIVLFLPADNISVGEHVIGEIEEDYTAKYIIIDASDNYVSVPGSGVINITSMDNGILTGTFNFDAVPVGESGPIMNFTEGEFSIDIN